MAAVETAVGRETLGDSPSDKDAAAAGQKEFLAWLDDHDVRIDPRYGVAIEQGQPVVLDTGLSYSTSKTAKAADAQTPDTTYAGALPSTQRCG